MNGRGFIEVPSPQPSPSGRGSSLARRRLHANTGRRCTPGRIGTGRGATLGVRWGGELREDLCRGDDVAVDAELFGVDAEGKADELGKMEDRHLEAVY